MNQDRQDPGREPEKTPAELEAEIAELSEEQRRCEAKARELIAAEAAGQGSRAAEIHALKQKKQMLNTEIKHRQVRLNWLLMDFR